MVYSAPQFVDPSLTHSWRQDIRATEPNPLQALRILRRRVEVGVRAPMSAPPPSLLLLLLLPIPSLTAHARLRPARWCCCCCVEGSNIYAAVRLTTERWRLPIDRPRPVLVGLALLYVCIYISLIDDFYPYSTPFFLYFPCSQPLPAPLSDTETASMQVMQCNGHAWRGKKGGGEGKGFAPSEAAAAPLPKSFPFLSHPTPILFFPPASFSVRSERRGRVKTSGEKKRDARRRKETSSARLYISIRTNYLISAPRVSS